MSQSAVLKKTAECWELNTEKLRNTSTGGTNEHYKRTIFFNLWNMILTWVCCCHGDDYEDNRLPEGGDLLSDVAE